MKKGILLLLLFLTHDLFAQKEANNWCFGFSSFITFNSGKPQVLKKISMLARFGAANISSSDGKLLLYTDGGGIWDGTHNGIPNSKFSNQYTCTQSAIITPWPDSSHLYFIFTPSGTNIDSLKYTVVNMKLRGGLGDVVSDKKDIKLPALSSGKVNVVKHTNKRDYWAVAPLANTDSIIAFLITSKGVFSQPVYSKTGLPFKTGNYSYGDMQHSGYFKISPDGKKLCDINTGDLSLFADFDAATGKVSNVWLFDKGFSNYGIEFSAKSNYMYVNDYAWHRISQYDLAFKTKQTFLLSRKTIDSSGNNYFLRSCLQLATDGKIYISEKNPDYDYLHVIHSPDSAGRGARFKRNEVYLGPNHDNYVHTGLPDMVQSFFHKPSFGVKQNCANDTVFFTIKDTYELDSVRWHFADTASGALNFSTQTKNVFHYYKKLGTYKVRLISFHKTYTDTIYETFLLKPLKPNLGKDTNFCKSKFLMLSPDQEYAGYKWSNSQSIKSIYVTNPGTYYLTVSDYSGCKGSDTIKISKPVVKADFTINDSSQCFRVNDFKLRESTTYTGGLRQKSVWFFNDSIISNDSLVNLSFKEIGSYPVKLISESYGGCRDSITKTLSVNPNAKVDFSINDSSQCLNTNRFNFTNTTPDTGNISYQWDLGDQTISSQKNIIGKIYPKDSFYKIRLISTTIHNCKDTIAKKIVVLPNPKANFSWDLACSRTITKFTFTGTKPSSPITTIFHWNFNNESPSYLENPSYIFTLAGTKKISLATTASNGCTDTIKKNVVIKPQSKADFTATDVCETDSAVFINKSQDATGYKWKFGDGQTTKLPTPKHKYQISSTTTYNVTLVAQVANGCSDSISKAVTINKNPSSDFSYTYSGAKVDLKITKAGNSYQWKFGTTDSVKTTATTYTHTIKSSDQTKVCLTATDVSGCSSQTCKNVSVGILKLSKSGGFKIYPNPNSGSFTIEIENPSKDVSIEIFNLLGKLLKTIETNSSKSVYEIDLNSADGIYLVRVKNGGAVWNQKVFISFGEDTNR